MATNSISIAIELEGQDALNTIKALEKGFDGLSKNAVKDVNKMDGAISSFTGNLAAMAAVKAFDIIKDQILNSVQAFTKFEDGITSVAKTTNFSAKEVKAFSKNIEAMSKKIPASTEELLGIAEAAGQLGVKGVKSVSIFTETIAKLGRVSNLEGDVAATTLARILNVTNENIDSVGTLADVIVDLGNNFAASEAEIAAITSEIAKATSQFGVSSAEAAALGATLTSLGVRAEEAGGVMSKSFIAIDQAIRSGGKPLERLSKLTGIAGDALKKAFKDDAIGVFQSFTEGLKKVNAAGGNVTQTLGQLGIKGIRVSKVLPTLANNSALFEEALRRANVQVEEGGAVNGEFGQILDLTSTKMQLFSTASEQLSRQFFGSLAPAFNNVLDVMTAFLEKLSAGTPLEEAQANAKGLAATIKDVGETTAGVNNILPDFLANINQSFADDRIKRMNEELAITNAEVASLSKNSTGLEKIEADIVLAEKALKDLNAEIADESISDKLFGKSDEDRTAETDALHKIKGALINLNEERAKEIALVKAGDEAALEAAAKKAELRTAEAEAEKVAAENKKTFLEEIRMANDEADAERREVQKLAKKMENDEDFQRLSEHLGKEDTARQLYAAKQIKDDTKRKAALAKIADKARASEKVAEEQRIKEDELRQKQLVQQRMSALNTIASLQSSNSGILFNIGKASSLALAGINVSEGVTKALAAFPPPYNFAAAAAVGAAGAVNIANIAGAKRPDAGRFANGGIIGGNSFSGDQLNAGVNSGEVIFNKRQQKNLFNAVDSGNVGGGGNSFVFNNPTFLSEDGIDNVIDSINDRVEFGNKELKAS